MKKIVSMAVIAVLFLSAGGFVVAQIRAKSNRHVILISFDGLRPDAITRLGPEEAPNFHKIIAEGASTLNARTDPDRTVTMPNHTCMLTGRGVLGEKGHGYTDNRSTDKSIHENKGSYVSGIFDVAKKHGLMTGFFVSKLKFQVFLNSYGENAPHGSKIDVSHVSDQNDEETVNALLAQMGKRLPRLTFVHFAGPDKAGHKYNWDLTPGSYYWSAVKAEDVNLGKILDAVRRDPKLAGSTVIIITADHGGVDDDHDDVTRIENYRIPLIIWGKDVAMGKDLYKININIRRDPEDKQIPYGQDAQPIRNGDAANCVLSVLGLPPVPGSTIGNPDPLRLSEKQE